MAVNDDSARRRRRRARETRIEIDIEAEIRAKYPNRRVDLVAEEARRGDGASWSASAEAGFGAIESVAQLPSVGSGADELAAEPEMRELVGVGVSDRPRRARRRSGAPVAPALGDDWDPSQPLPGEPEDRPLRRQMRSAPQLAARLTESVGDSTHEVFAADRRVPSGPPDAYEMLRRQRDHIARQVQRAYADVHSVRTDALRRASQAESSAERAATARERAARLVREGRRLDEVGRRVSAEVPAAHDSWKAVHELRIESLKRAAEAEHGAERVAMLREKAARLLSEQRRLEAEMAKQLALRTR
jgi:hypothetical protein